MSNKKLVIIILLAIVALLFAVILFCIGVFGIIGSTDGCLYRYNFNKELEGGDTNILDATNPVNLLAIASGSLGISDTLNDAGGAVSDSISGFLEMVAGSATDGSLNPDNKEKVTQSHNDKISKTINLNATANYKAIATQDAVPDINLDPTTFGTWLNTSVKVKGNQQVKFSVKGKISLCRAYLPKNNLQDASDKDVNDASIAIPRVDDGSPPVTLYIDAKNSSWGNIAQVFKNDLIMVSLYKEQKTSNPIISINNSLKKTSLTADCRDGNTAYSPLCGRYMSYNPEAKYVDKCKFVAECSQCNPHQQCIGPEVSGVCNDGYETVHDWCSCYENEYKTPPEKYTSDGFHTFPYSQNINELTANLDRDCKTEQEFVDGDYQKQKYFWYSANNATGLLYRYDNSEEPTDKSNIGSNYSFAEIQSDQSLNYDKNYQTILNTTYTASDSSYLQYRLYNQNENPENNTGGYVLSIKQTKCRHIDGQITNDTFQGRGQIEYVIANNNNDPNNNNATGSALNLDASGSGSLTVGDGESGYLWMRIKNKQEDYQDSFGQYSVQITTIVESGDFVKDAFKPFLTSFKDKIKNTATTLFRNMTCYQGSGVEENCTNFFDYVRGMLILYIMIYGMFFLLGMVQISQTDLVIRVIKIAFVAGLIDGQTFEFFSNYVFDFVINFSDEIIANMSGYTIYSGSAVVSNPLTFMSAVLTKIFTGSLFAAQLIALLSMGLQGVVYFIIIFVSIGVLLIVLFRSIAVYLMAQLAVGILLGIAPLFLTFMLFQSTRYLFDNWIKFTFKYMIEPVILLAGIIVLTQLTTIFLDYIMGYSVCWKCVLPVRLPFVMIPGVSPAFLGVDLACLFWFSPWGMDWRSGMMGVNLQYIATLFMLVYCMWGYLDFSDSIVSKITGGMTGPSATVMAKPLTNKVENTALKQAGLDAKSRKEMKDKLGARMKTIGKSNSKLKSGSRKDVPVAQETKKWTSAKPSGTEKISIGSHREAKKEGPVMGGHRGAKEGVKDKPVMGGHRTAKSGAEAADKNTDKKE